MGNPFTEDSKDLLKLDSRKIADQTVVHAIQRAENIGQEQYDTFVAEHLLGVKPISDPIKKNKPPLFSTCRPPAKKQSKTKLQVSSLKND